ncbi:hypothetical protein [Holophaga foetida]|uniref:hypothetical protein n=1 Tax=Holophaga foetida TaxID=35839 RepID=UPI00024742BF|nr:hypothetical protein [Holophaga foetida]
MKKSLAFLSALSFATAGFAAAPAEAPGLKVTGFLQYRYEWTENPRAIAEDSLANGEYIADPSGYGNASIDAKSNTRLNMFLFLDNQFDGHTRFHAILGAEHLSGRTTKTNIEVKEAYVAAKFGPAEIQVGRFLSDVGLGTLGGSPYMDGIHVTAGNKYVSGQVYVTKFGNANSVQVLEDTMNSHMTFVSGDLKVMPIDGLTICGSYFADVTSEDDACNYKTYALGAEYKYVANNVPWFTVSGEYAKNNSDGAEFLNTDYSNMTAENPIAYYGKVKVLGANPFMPGTAGFSVQYRKAEAGFDCMGMANPMTWNAPFNWTTPSGGGIAENHKGFELAGEVTVLPRTILKASYGLMKTVDMHAYGSFGAHKVDATTDSEKYFTAAVFYLF